MSDPYEPESEFERLFESAGDGWRGEVHSSDDESWRGINAAEWDDDLFCDDDDADIWQEDTETIDDSEPWLFRHRRDDDSAR